MIQYLISVVVLLSAAAAPARAVEGLVTVPSAYSVTETLANLEVALKSKGVTVFARIDHGANAKGVGLPLRATELLIFGNPQGGTALMAAQQTIGIDLPMKVLAYEDEAGKVWLAYNDPAWVAARHGLKPEMGAVLAAMSAALKAVTGKAAGLP